MSQGRVSAAAAPGVVIVLVAACGVSVLKVRMPLSHFAVAVANTVFYAVLRR